MRFGSLSRETDADPLASDVSKTNLQSLRLVITPCPARISRDVWRPARRYYEARARRNHPESRHPPRLGSGDRGRAGCPRQPMSHPPAGRHDNDSSTYDCERPDTNAHRECNFGTRRESAHYENGGDKEHGRDEDEHVKSSRYRCDQRNPGG